MTLVERFIEINNWPTSRKVVLLCAVAIPPHALNWWIGHRGAINAGIVNVEMFDWLMAVWGAGAVLCLLLGLSAWRAGREASWLGFLLILIFGGWGLALVYALGLWTTTGLLLMPVAVITATLFFGERVGWFAFFYSFIGLIGIAILQALELMPYAPMMLHPESDAGLVRWGRGIAVAMLGFFVICFLLCILLVSARKLQETRLQQAQKLIRRYVPSQVADSILSGQQAAVEKHERRKLTIFFSDLVGFTDISEEMEPEDLSRILNEYFSEMTRIASKHGGTVDELAGDAVLVFFGAPTATDDKDHALRAVRMASEMQQAVASLNAKWREAGIDVVLKVRMGLNTGVVTIGNFGSPERMKYSALGKHVNIAARLQSHCEPGRVLLSHATWLLVNDQFPGQPKGELTLKGIVKPVTAYEITA